MIKVGIQINKIHYAMVFNEAIGNILSDYITLINEERAKVKETNTVLGDAYKLMGNSIYGKTVCKDIEDCYIFTSVKQFIERWMDNNLLDYNVITTG